MVFDAANDPQLIHVVAAYDRLPDKLSRVFGAYLLSHRRRSADLAVPVHILNRARAAAHCDAAWTARKSLPSTRRYFQSPSRIALCPRWFIRQ